MKYFQENIMMIYVKCLHFVNIFVEAVEIADMCIAAIFITNYA